MNRSLLLAGCLYGLIVSASLADAQIAAPQKEGAAAGQDMDKADAKEHKTQSPWLIVPLVASSPKMGTSFGGLGAYLHYFDPKSQVSMFGLMYQYSTTHSMDGGVFARTSFKADHQRLEGFVGFGYVENTYEDYMGTGETLQTTDDIHLIAGRYLYRFTGDWFVGPQAAFANYLVSGTTPADQAVLDTLGLTGFDSGGIGVTLMHDSRDNQDMPVKGWYASAGNIVNRDWLGAQSDYTTYRVDSRWFVGHGNGHVFAVRQNNQFTHDAPASAEATVVLRGYKMEQYLARNMSSIEVEERIRFSKRWGMTVFGGVGWLYGGSSGEDDSDGAYPSYGAGVHFVLKPDDHMLVNLEYAHGDKDNYGVYLKFGYAW